MSNNERGKKSANTKRKSGFDFAAAGRRGGKAKVKKGLAVLKEKDPEAFAEHQRKAGQARQRAKQSKD